MLTAFSLWSFLWIVDTSSTAVTSWLWVILPLIGAALSSVAAMGCRVRMREDRLEDLVAWRRVAAYAIPEVERIEVRRGAWRFFVVITPATQRPLLGLGPSQFPGTLLPESRERDQLTIATLRGGGHVS
jgi:hypothetical protein